MTSATSELSDRLVNLLGLEHQPVGISFESEVPVAEKAPHLPVAASCVFWMHGHERAFSTLPEDHGNCSVGRYTHGLAAAEDIIDKADVGALLEVGWVTMDAFADVAALSRRPAAISYGPLGGTEVTPDVVLLRLNPRQMMQINDAVAVEFSGKPQCQILPRAVDRQVVAASMGCALSRARTGMGEDELTCAVPGGRLEELVDSLEGVVRADKAVSHF